MFYKLFHYKALLYHYIHHLLNTNPHIHISTEELHTYHSLMAGEEKETRQNEMEEKYPCGDHCWLSIQRSEVKMNGNDV